jgi:pyruvate dehydrogenase E2 component (dihydrolipoamide acetyltransferase)
MELSKSTIPHVYFTIEVDAAAMKEMRLAKQKQYSYNAMIIYNAVRCLKKYPYLASRYTEEGRIIPREINIGIAISRGEELFVPVIKKIEEGPDELVRIEQEIRAMITRAESGTLKQEDITGGVFTVTNLGSFGIDSFTAVINPPETAILAVGAMRERVVARNGGIYIRPIFNLTLSVDHRVANGAYAAGFLKALKEKLENIQEEFIK